MDVKNGNSFSTLTGLVSLCFVFSKGSSIPLTHYFALLTYDSSIHSLRKRGLTLYELGNHLVNDLDLLYAINLDGGSSTVLIDGATGHVKNHPTCLDVVPTKCERKVATVFCVSRGGEHPSSRDNYREASE
jgi:hypothetical protein